MAKTAQPAAPAPAPAENPRGPRGTPPGGGRWTWDESIGEAGDWKSLDPASEEKPQE